MKKQGKAKAAAAKPDATKGQAAKVKAEKAELTPAEILEQERAAAIADNVSDSDILREIVKAVWLVADRLESIRRTLWRMSEIREYESKSAKGKPEKGGKPKANRKPETAEGGDKSRKG